MQKTKKYIKYILTILTIISIILLITIKIKLNNKETSIVEEKKELYSVVPEEEPTPEITKVSVDIKGAVTNPGVYEIENDKKVIDVINLAGGLKDEANTSLINLAKQVTNEMVIIIYTEKEIEEATKNESSSLVKPIDTTCNCPKITNDACISQQKDTASTKNDTTSQNKDTTDTLININTATQEELQTISGVGESKAKAIIEYRSTNGNFETIEDIKNVSGIGDSLYEKIKDHITV